MKKIFCSFLLLTLVCIAFSSCGLFKCKHKSVSERTITRTCDSDGYTEYTCNKCGEVTTENIVPKLGHNYTDKIFAPSCVAEGYTEHNCENCGNIYNDSIVAITAHRFNGGDCIYCGFKHPEEAITSDIEWYSADKAVFTISTKEQLAGLASLVNEGTTFANTVIYLNADIDLGYAPWIPIGNVDNAFAGHFVGNGHIISSLNLSSTGSYVGLFGNVTGELSDFTVDNASVFVGGANNYIGILCGYTTNKITKVNVDGYVDAKDSSNVGGIVGSTTFEITFCESVTEVNGFDNVGGIAGSANVSTTVFKGLVNYGNVKGSTYSGGLFGVLNGGNSVIYIDNSQNYGDVSGMSYIGGIAGHVEGKVSSIIQSSLSSASISGEYYVGGFVGKAVNVAISNCSNEGTKISASSCLLVGDVYYAYLGGYAGYGYSFDHCVNSSDIEYLARGIYVGGIAGYISDSVTECSNSGNITGYDLVGGIAGYVVTPNAISVINLSNTGNIAGKSKLGGIAGQWTYANPITFGEISNSGKVNGTSFLGGVIGNFNYSTPAVLSAYNLNSTGDVIGTESHIGGLFGYVNGKDSSTISNASVSANISGLYLVGGLIGKADTVKLSDSKNDGSTVTATGFIIEGEDTNVYLGGFVGLGYQVSGCTNTVDINYTSLGNFVGGIAGKSTSEIHNCTNDATITSNASIVGGIAGQAQNYATASNENFASNLVNNGAVKGADKVGGILGVLYHEVHHGSCGGYTLTTSISGLKNSGNVSGKNKIGGIIGAVHVNNTGDGWCDHWPYNGHYTYSYFRLTATNLNNSGDVSGIGKVGEIYGYFYSDGSSTLDNYTVTGNITVNGELLEGNYDVGSNTNLTLTNRVAPEVEEEAPEAEEAPAA